MKKAIILITAGFMCLMINAQSVTLHAFTATGGSYAGNSYSIDYAVGEVFTGTLSSGQGTFLTQGVIQPEVLDVSNIQPLINQIEQVAIYPNPFINYINVTIKEIDEEKVTVKVVDITGKIRLEEDFKLELKSGKIQLDVKDMNPGIYFVSISSNDKLLKSAKLYKK